MELKRNKSSLGSIDDGSSSSSWAPSDMEPVVDVAVSCESDRDANDNQIPSDATSISGEEQVAAPPDNHGYTSIGKKRKYVYRSRNRRAPPKPTRRSKWFAKLSTTTLASFRRQTCCQSLRCFRRINYEFYVKIATTLFNSSSTTRRTILQSYLGSDKRFRFDGHEVCVTFLKDAFHFSTVMIAEVASGKVKRPFRSRLSETSLVPSALSENATPTSNQSTTLESPAEPALRTKKDAIVSFILRMAEDCGDSMPHRPEIHLPFHQIQEVFPIFSREFKQLYPTSESVSPVYFRRVWLLHCPHIKVMKSSRFAKCEICEGLRMKLRERIVTGESTEQIKEQRRQHLSFVFNERMGYQKKKDRARLHSSECCSLIIDGADEAAFGLPHLTTISKGAKGHTMKVKLVGQLEHKPKNCLTLLTMTQEHQTGANHIVEVLHRFLCRKREHGTLPRKLYLQLDNCSRENKNKYMMAYLELLVAKHVFDRVECGFLPVGHTHEDIDQAFSSTSGRLKVTNAITLSDLHSVLRTTYGGDVRVEHMKRMANFSGLCEQERCLRKVNNITQWRYFLFLPDSTCDPDPSNGNRRTTCHVKKTCGDSWQKLFPGVPNNEPSGILRGCPDLSKTPNLQIKCPDGLNDVNKRFWTEEQRINDVDKMIELSDLRDFVFKARVDPFHWDLSTSVETEFERTRNPEELCDEDDAITERQSDVDNTEMVEDDAITPVHAQASQSPSVNSNNNAGIEGNSAQHSSSEPNNRVDYCPGSFVVVQNDDDDSTSAIGFWVAKVLSVVKEGESNYAAKIKVHWYDHDSNVSDSPDALVAKYHPCYQRATSKRARRDGSSSKTNRKELQKPWLDTIHTDTVTVSFEKLTKRNTLPLAVQKKLAQ